MIASFAALALAVSVAPLDVPVPAGATQPGISALPDGRLALSWVEPAPGGAALRFALRERDGSFGVPRTVASGADLVRHGVQVPIVAADAAGALYATWLVVPPGGGHEASHVVAAASTDGGVTWTAPRRVHADASDAEHGFTSLVGLDPGPGLGVVWLDGGTAQGPGGATSVRYARLGPDGRATGEEEIDARACDCCQTAAARAARGPVVAFRDRSAAEVRDVAVSRRGPDRWSEARAVGRDLWRIEGCPVNGPQLAADGDRVALAWFAAPDDAPRVEVAFSDDAGATFGAPLRIDSGHPVGRVDVALLADGSALVAWLEKAENGPEVRVRRVARDGAPGEPLAVGPSTTWSLPRLERGGDEVVLVWIDAGARVHAASIRP